MGKEESLSSPTLLERSWGDSKLRQWRIKNITNGKPKEVKISRMTMGSEGERKLLVSLTYGEGSRKSIEDREKGWRQTGRSAGNKLKGSRALVLAAPNDKRGG